MALQASELSGPTFQQRTITAPLWGTSWDGAGWNEGEWLLASTPAATLCEPWQALPIAMPTVKPGPARPPAPS